MSEIKNNGAPTMKTKGALGDVCTDISTGAQYKCTGSYEISGQTEYEWKKLNNTLEKEESVDMDPEKPEEVVNEQPVETEEPIDEKSEEVVEEQPKEESKQEIKNPNPNHGKPNNRPNNRTDYASKFKG